MSVLHKLNPDEVLEEGFLTEYNSGIHFFHLQLVHLNANIYILDHVLEFPYRVLLPGDRSLFFRYVFENSFYASLLIITRIATDQGSEFFTLPRFKNKVREAMQMKYRKEFDELLRAAKFNKNVQLMLEKAATLRSMRVAHSLEDFVIGIAEEPIVNFGELKTLRDHLVELFDVFTFNVDHLLEPSQYSPRLEIGIGGKMKSDIQELLELIASNSPGLKMPETDPKSWKILRSILHERELRAFNQFRNTFGLPEA
jgi:hypothetical protein